MKNVTNRNYKNSANINKCKTQNDFGNFHQLPHIKKNVCPFEQNKNYIFYTRLRPHRNIPLCTKNIHVQLEHSMITQIKLN